MKLDFIDLGKLSIAKINMRHKGKDPDIADIRPPAWSEWLERRARCPSRRSSPLARLGPARWIIRWAPCRKRLRRVAAPQ